MKKALLALFFFVGIYCCLEAGSGSKRWLDLPDGRYARINDTLYAAVYEVTNENYRAFLHAIRKDSSMDLFRKCLYDSNAWVTAFPGDYNVPMKDKYHNHPVFHLYPEVNVSQFAAMKYCEWLTAQYRHKRGKKGDMLLCKLPSEAEWLLITDADSSGFPRGMHDGKDNAGKYQVNIKTMQGDSLTIFEDGGFYTAKEDLYPPNRYGLYNVIGNVSEMTDVQNVSKGGNWWSRIRDCAVDKRDTFATPDPRVGFRVFVQVLRR